MGLSNNFKNLTISDLLQRLLSFKIKLIYAFIVVSTNIINAQHMNLYNLKMTQKNHFWILETSQLFEVHDTIDNSVRSVYKIDSSFIQKIEERLFELPQLTGIPKEELDYSFKSLETIMNKYKFIFNNYISYFKISLQIDTIKQQKLLDVHFYQEDLIECILSYCGEVILRYNEGSSWDIATKCAEFTDVAVEINYYEPYIKSKEGVELRFFGRLIVELQSLDDMSFAYWINEDFLKKKPDIDKPNFKLNVKKRSLNINDLLPPDFPVYYPPLSGEND
jgi:hypothetical protein